MIGAENNVSNTQVLAISKMMSASLAHKTLIIAFYELQIIMQIITQIACKQPQKRMSILVRVALFVVLMTLEMIAKDLVLKIVQYAQTMLHFTETLVCVIQDGAGMIAHGGD